VIKPILLAFLAASVLLGAAFLAISTLHSSKTDGTASAGGTGGSTFTEALLKAVMPVFRGSCVRSANAALTKNGVDATADGVGAKIEIYCTCATDHFAGELTIPELLKFKLNPSSEPAASKIRNIMQECQEKSG
jgi:hypothetical protein